MGFIKKVPAKEHECDLPRVYVSTYDGVSAGSGERVLGIGTIWQCDDCGWKWELVKTPWYMLFSECKWLRYDPTPKDAVRDFLESMNNSNEE